MRKEFNFEDRLKCLKSLKDKTIAKCTSIEQQTEVYTKHFNDISLLVNIDRIVDWAISRKCRVMFDSSPTTLGFKHGNLIVIGSRLPLEKQFYFLLHEVGHILVERPITTYNERYSSGYIVGVDDPESSTIRHRIDIVAEEFEAWYRGKKLAKRIGVKVDDDKFEKYRVASLISYFKWTLYPRLYKDKKLP